MKQYVKPCISETKNGTIEVHPEFQANGKDFMTKGNRFYAVLDPKTNFWITDESEAIDLVDEQLYAFAREKFVETDDGRLVNDIGKPVKVLSINNYQTKKLKEWKEFLTKVAPNHNYHPLDSDITPIDAEVKPSQYRSKRLLYPIAKGTTNAYEKFMSTCYSAEERQKIEWAIGSIFTGESKHIQKFIVLYGAPGTGKSTVMNLIQDLFEGYWTAFDVNALVSRNNQFATAAFKDNPLVAIHHDCDMSKIHDNSIFNSLVSHETIYINEKGKPQYPMRISSFIFLGTNEIVDVPDTKRGIVRRMIDVYPTGRTLPKEEYDICVENMRFELGAIAYHCIQVFESMGKNYYNSYSPTQMINKSNILRNFIFDKYDEFVRTDPISRDMAYDWYRDYFEKSGLGYAPKRIIFGEQLREYFDSYKDRARMDGKLIRHVYSGFRRSLFADDIVEIDSNVDARVKVEEEPKPDIPEWLRFEEPKDSKCKLDDILAEYPAQYANDKGTPKTVWAKVKTKLKDLDTSKLHYTKVPEKLICVDFDIKIGGKKSIDANLEAASKFPETYAEVSQSGSAIHLHYWYDGDPTELSRVYDLDVEVKVYTGDASLRRRLTKCNDREIAHISSGLPLKGDGKKKMLDFKVVENERMLRCMIKKNLNKEYHGYTKPSMDYIFKLTEDAYNAGKKYDITDMRPAIMEFAVNSTNNSQYCLKLMNKMHWKSDEPSDYISSPEEDKIVFFDVEVFSNVFICCWKYQGSSEVIRMINPKPIEIEELCKKKLVGFNNRKYDNHILYAWLQGYSNEQLFRLSQRIIANSLNSSFAEAYNLSYADIYDFSSKKQSLKKWEIELGIHHMENSYPWDQPLPKEHWNEVADYCCNDVDATEATFDACKQDFIAREVLADLSGLSVNHSTRQHCTKIIFGNDKNPTLVYTDLSKEFPGYEFKNGKSLYLGEDPSEGGYVYAEPGIYFRAGLLDVESLHPHTIIALNLFGEYTWRYKDILEARLAIKHHDIEKARGMLGGVLAKYLESEEQADKLAKALKIIINSIYGYTCATFANPFKSPENVDNIVAKRGALFMMTLKKKLQDMGVQVIHVKTDSIKIPNITKEIIDVVNDFGHKYGYNFDHEATYEKICLVNKSTYIARYDGGKHDGEWTATGKQFQVPYVFKTLFTHEDVVFDDLCETFETKTAFYLDRSENQPEGYHDYKFVGKVGRFCPVRPGTGGGFLMRDKGETYIKQKAAYDKCGGVNEKGKPLKVPSKYALATGTDGYLWREAEQVKSMHLEKDIDIRYYAKLADDAVMAISQFGDFDAFANAEAPF